MGMVAKSFNTKTKQEQKIHNNVKSVKDMICLNLYSELKITSICQQCLHPHPNNLSHAGIPQHPKVNVYTMHFI